MRKWAQPPGGREGAVGKGLTWQSAGGPWPWACICGDRLYPNRGAEGEAEARKRDAGGGYRGAGRVLGRVLRVLWAVLGGGYRGPPLERRFLVVSFECHN